MNNFMVDVDAYAVGSVVVARVLQMDESLRDKGVLVESGGWSLRSVYKPELDLWAKHWYIWGAASNKDEQVIVHDCGTKKKARKAIKRLARLLTIINGLDADLRTSVTKVWRVGA